MSFVAISKVRYPDPARRDIQNAGMTVLSAARQQPGLIAISFHQSCDTNETMMYWEWESRSDHDTFMAGSDWASVVEQSKSVFEADGVEFSIEMFDRLA